MTFCPESDTESPDRPALEIEITPEMIAAGVEAYYGLGDIREPEDIVELIFEAMIIAKRSHGEL
jgi:hypothetical protein